MALGLLLGVSWICLLVFYGSDGSPATKGYGYPHETDSRNMVEEDSLTSPTFDESYFQASNNQPAGSVYTSYDTPTVAHQPAWTPYGQNLPNAPSNRQVDRLINGVPRDWGQENLEKPITFPLSSNPAKPLPGPSPTAYHGPPSNFQASESPNLSLQPEPLDSGYGVIDFNADSSATGGNVPHLVYEDVFQYPETQSSDGIANPAGGYGQADESRESSTGYSSTYDEPSSPSNPTNVGPQYLWSLPRRGFSTPGRFSGHFGQPAHQPREIPQPQKTFDAKKVEVNQRVSEPILPPPPPPSFISQSINSYARSRDLSSNTRYTPEFPPPMPVSSKGPAPSQPANPQNAKNPGGAKW